MIFVDFLCDFSLFGKSFFRFVGILFVLFANDFLCPVNIWKCFFVEDNGDMPSSTNMGMRLFLLVLYEGLYNMK